MKTRGLKKDENTIFSIHLPGDYNGVSYLLDEYEYAEKMAEFSLKRIKEKICKSDQQALIPFKQIHNNKKESEEKYTRRMIERQVNISGKS